MSELASKGQLRASFWRWAVVTVPGVVLLGFASGKLAPSGDENAWYTALAKPDYIPAGWVFPTVWATLYVMMGVALAVVIHARGSRWRGAAMLAFAAQLFANLAWSPLFFGWHQVTAALVLIVVIFVLALLTTVLFGRVRRLAAWLMVPYLVWLALATIALWQVDRMNPDAERLAPGASSTQILV